VKLLFTQTTGIGILVNHQPIKYKKNKIMSTKNIITTITELRVPEILKSKKSR
jgi:hypothetical protein